MRRALLCTLWALGSLLLLAGCAHAHTYTFQCAGTAGELEARINGTSAWTTTDGLAGTMAPLASGDIIRIDGTTNGFSCRGDIFVNTSGVTFENHSGTSTLILTDEIDGTFEVVGADITINGLALTCHCMTSTANTTGLSPFDEDAALLLRDGATVLFENGEITSSFADGIFATGNAMISLVNTTIVGNGIDPGQLNTFDSAFTSGVYAEAGSKVRLGNPDHSGTVTIAGNGQTFPGSEAGCLGYGVFLRASTLDSFAATIGGNGTARTSSSENFCGQIALQAGSSARLEGNTIAQTDTAIFQAVQVLGGSSLVTTDNGAPSPLLTTISAGLDGAMMVAAASSAVLNASTIASSGNALPTIVTTASSTIAVAGGNSISNPSTGGVVFQIDHLSSLFQVAGHQVGFTDAADAVTGSAFVQVQSSADLGIGPISAAPSLNWSVPSGDCILVQQNSSFRLSGGVTIAGAPAAACSLNSGAVSTTIVIQQESNAFFNVGRGGSLAISGGGRVSCVFAGFPNAHVTGKGNITPAGAQPVMIGSWSASNTATSPGCLGP